MDTLNVSLDALVQAKGDGRKEQKLELGLDVPLQEPTEIQNTDVLGVQHVSSRYRVSFKGIAYDQVEKMCQHVRSLGYDSVMIQVGDFPRRADWDEKTPVHIDFLGLEAIADTYEFRDFIHDKEATMRVKTSAITHYNAEFGPINNAISPIDLFERGVIGYSIKASITDRLDGAAAGAIVVDSKNRRIAKEVHQEVLDALRILYHADTPIENASTKALEQVFNNSKHKALFRFHQY